MKNSDNDLVSSCFEYASNNANSIIGNKITYFIEKYRIQHDFSYVNKAIKQIEQASVWSSEDQSLIGSVWSLILVKSNQYTVEVFDIIILLIYDFFLYFELLSHFGYVYYIILNYIIIVYHHHRFIVRLGCIPYI